MIFGRVSRWLFCALALAANTAFAEAPGGVPRPHPRGSESVALQEPPKVPQFVLDACLNHAEGEACALEFQGQKLSGTCKKIPDRQELACLPAGFPAQRRDR